MKLISFDDAIAMSGWAIHRDTLERWQRAGKLHTERGANGSALMKSTSFQYRAYPECPACRERFWRNDLKRVYCSRACSETARRKKQRENAFSKRLLNEFLISRQVQP